MPPWLQECVKPFPTLPKACRSIDKGVPDRLPSLSFVPQPVILATMLCRHFFSLFCFALGLFFDLALARVIYVSPLTLAEHKTGNDWHILNVVGDYKGYSVKTAMVDGVGDSEAQCTNGVGDRQWVGPGRNALFSGETL